MPFATKQKPPPCGAASVLCSRGFESNPKAPVGLSSTSANTGRFYDLRRSPASRKYKRIPAGDPYGTTFGFRRRGRRPLRVRNHSPCANPREGQAPPGVLLPPCRYAGHGVDVELVKACGLLGKPFKVRRMGSVAAVGGQEVPVQAVVHDHNGFHRARLPLVQSLPVSFRIPFSKCPLASASIPSAMLAGKVPPLERTAARSGASAPDMTIILKVGSL